MDASGATSIDPAILDILVLAVGLGSIGIAAVAVERTQRYHYAAIIGVVAGLTAAAQMAPVTSLAAAALVDIAIIVGGGAGGMGACALIGALIKSWTDTRNGQVRPLSATMREILAPGFWSGETDSAIAEFSTPDAVRRRWFVAVAAAAGGIVGALVDYDFFWNALNDALQPRNLLSILLLTAVSLVLIGPVHESIIAFQLGGAREQDHAPPPRIRLRPAVRLGLVALLLMAVELGYDCLGRSIQTGDTRVAIEILTGGATPGVVSYYWSAALQLGGSSQRFRQALAGANLSVAFLYYGLGVAIVLGLYFWGSSLLFGSFAPNPWILPVALFLGAAPARAIAYVMAGLPALVGGAVLTHATGHRTLAPLFAALCLASLVRVAAVELILLTLRTPLDWSLVIRSPIDAGGWMFGLIASGFPQLVSQAKKLRSSAALP